MVERSPWTGAQPMPGGGPFGGAVTVSTTAAQFVAAAAASGGEARRTINDKRGLLLIRGLHEMVEDTSLLVRLAQCFGAELDNFAELQPNEWPAESVHPGCPHILLLTNRGASVIPTHYRGIPNPTPEGEPIPLTYPARKHWHSDQCCTCTNSC